MPDQPTDPAVAVDGVLEIVRAAIAECGHDRYVVDVIGVQLTRRPWNPLHGQVLVTVDYSPVARSLRIAESLHGQLHRHAADGLAASSVDTAGRSVSLWWPAGHPRHPDSAAIQVDETVGQD